MTVRAASLRRYPFLKPLPDEELARLGKHITEITFRAGTLIFPDAGEGDCLYLVKSGRIVIFKSLPEGDQILNVMGPGDVFGEMGVLDGKPRSAAARAEKDSALLQVPRGPFLDTVKRFPILFAQAARDSSDRLRKSDIELIHQLELRNLQLRKLYETSLGISRHLDLQRALDAILERAKELLEADNGSLYLYERGSNRLTTASGETARPGQGEVGRAFACNQLVITKPRHGGPAGHPRAPALSAPLCVENQPLGVLHIERAVDTAPFTPQDGQLLLLLANQAAIAVENARLHQTSIDKARLDGELHAAYQVQHGLLPRRLPRIPGFQIASLWRPARRVSGDFYDVIPLPGGRWGLVIADVSDKGMPAALFMASCRGILRASAVVVADAATAIQQANQVICADAQNGMFVTLFFAILDPRTRSLSYVNAGHNPPLLLRARERRLERLQRTALPLGIYEDAPVHSEQIELDPGDVLTLYTDGITDANNLRMEPFGEMRLATLVSNLGPSGAPPVTRSIERAIAEFTGNQPQYDDITLLVLSARGT